MSLRFSEAGPEFPEPLVDALLAGEVVFLCGAGVSAPQLPGFGALVTRCFASLNVEMSPSELLSFDQNRFEEALGSLSRRIVNPAEMTEAVVRELQSPQNADLSHHHTVLRLSRDLENRPAIVTTNFDTLIERALREVEDADVVRTLSFAGQDLPSPGSANFGGIIHIHGRIADNEIGVDETPLIVTSADYGDAYMRSGWASRFLFDLCRCKTIVLIGYSAGDAPVRYFLNVLEADRQRFPDLRPVYAIDAVLQRDQADVRWAALAVEPIAYQYLPDAAGEPTSHAALWPDLERLADLVERPRTTRRDWAQTILAKPFEETDLAERDRIAWLFDGQADLWSVAITTITDGDWFDFFAERKLWKKEDAAWVLAAWLTRDLISAARFRRAVEWLEKLGRPFAEELGRRIRQTNEVPPLWLRMWRLLSHSRPDRADSWDDRAYALMDVLKGPVVLHSDLDRAVGLLTPVLEIRNGRLMGEDDLKEKEPRRLSDLSWPHLTLADRGGAPELVDALLAAKQPVLLLAIAGGRLRATVGLALDMGLIEGDYDSNDSAVPSVEPHPQNEHHDGPIFLVDLIARLLEPATHSDREAVRAEAAGWRALPGILGIRLWLHALRQPALFEANEALAGVAELSLDAFWTIRRELALVLRDRAGDATPDLVAAVEQRILTEGMRYYERFPIEDGQADWRTHALDAEIWLRLNMLADAGMLSADGARSLDAIKAKHEYLARPVEDQDFFGSYSTGVHMVVGNAQPIIDASEGERLQVAREALVSHDLDKRQGWSAFCRTNPAGAFDTLRAAPLEDANVPLWRDLIGALSFPDESKTPDRNPLVIAVFGELQPASDAFITSLVDRLADLYAAAPRRAVPAIAQWWPRLFEAAVARDGEPFDHNRELYGDVINSPAGKLTQSTLIDVEGLRTANAAVEPSLLAALKSAAAAPGRQGMMARGALVRAAGFVLTIEGQTVTPLLEAALNADTDEGAALRGVLVADSSLSLVTSRTFAAPILRGCQEFSGKSHDNGNAAAKLIGPALSIVRNEQTAEDWGIGVSDVARVLRQAPPSLRRGAADVMKQWIHQLDDNRAVAWRTGIGPMLRAVWPRERTYFDSSLSRHFADLAISCDDAFPEALDQLLPLLSRAEGHGGAHSIETSQMPERFPRETLKLLWKLFGPGTTSNLYGVPKILERLVAALPAIETDRRLQWLDQKAPRYE